MPFEQFFRDIVDFVEAVGLERHALTTTRAPPRFG
jgi:hypothetical protein